MICLVSPLTVLSTVSFPDLLQTNLHLDVSHGEGTKYSLSPLPEITHPHFWGEYYFLFNPVYSSGLFALVLLFFPPWRWGSSAAERLLSLKLQGDGVLT